MSILKDSLKEIKASKVTYEFSLDAIKKLIAHDLGVGEDTISVTYKMQDCGDERSSYRNYQVYRVEVTHTPPAPLARPERPPVQRVPESGRARGPGSGF